MNDAGNRKPIKGFAPCRVFGAVLRLALADNNSPHGASPVAGKTNSQHRDWRN